MTLRPLSYAILLAACSAAYGQANEGAPSLVSPLSMLARPHPGKAMHEGSWDRGGGNADFRVVKAGETITLFDHEGAGIVRRFWVTIAPRSDQKIHRQA